MRLPTEVVPRNSWNHRDRRLGDLRVTKEEIVRHGKKRSGWKTEIG